MQGFVQISYPVSIAYIKTAIRAEVSLPGQFVFRIEFLTFKKHNYEQKQT